MANLRRGIRYRQASKTIIDLLGRIDGHVDLTPRRRLCWAGDTSLDNCKSEERELIKVKNFSFNQLVEFSRCVFPEL